MLNVSIYYNLYVQMLRFYLVRQIAYTVNPGRVSSNLSVAIECIAAIQSKMQYVLRSNIIDTSITHGHMFDGGYYL